MIKESKFWKTSSNKNGSIGAANSANNDSQGLNRA
jgi:hypothetical protein